VATTTHPAEPPSLGIEELDADHRRIADLVKRIAGVAEDAPREGPGRQLAGGMLRQLHAVTRIHFRKEESLMEAIGYADRADHRREHMMLLAELKVFIRNIERGDETLSPKTVERLQQWLVGHIVQSDRPLARVLRSGRGGRPTELSTSHWESA